VPKLIDLTGQRFGRLVAIRRAEDYCPPSKPRGGYPQWLCRCDCGKERVIKAGSLTKGATRSCGCYNDEVRARLIAERSKTHGMSNTPTYVVWARMLQRCRDQNCPGYRKYGAKGVRVCKRWHKFENFLSDMGKRPSARHSIDRIENARGYEPGNCRWATMKEQQNNRTNNRQIEFGGERLTLQQWSERTGLSYRTITTRIDRQGWSVEDALTLAPSPFPRGERS
jgi:hypothetical protein